VAIDSIREPRNALSYEAILRTLFENYESIYVIDADVCVSCGSCAEACPTEAIVEE